MKSLKGMRILAASHITHGFGCAQALEKFLRREAGEFALITHPLYGTGEFRSQIRAFQNGKETRKSEGPNLRKSEMLRYVKDAFLTFWWGLRGKQKHDLFIGMNCLVTAPGILLRALGRVKKVVYYTADYSGKRFQSGLLNRIYDAFDRFAVRRADMIWNVSGKIEQRRWNQGAARNKTLVVPNTVDFDAIPKTAGGDRRHNLVYVGGLNEGYGLEEFVELLPWVLQSYPKIEIDIIGGGVLEKVIREKASALGLGARVNFHGYVPYEKALEFLSRSSIGLAPYAADLPGEHYLRYCDPSKVKAYMACGCTVIIRNVPELAQLISSEKAGWVYETKEELQRVLEEVLSRPDRVAEVRERALGLSRRFENNAVFQTAFAETLQRWAAGGRQ